MKRLLTLLLLCAALPAAAQESVAPATLNCEELTAEVQRLHSRNEKWDHILAALPRISGYMQLGYLWDDDNRSSFYIKRVRLDFQGDIAAKLDYRLQFEFVGPKIVDAFLRYRPFQALNFQLGEFKIPFSIENTEYPPLKYEFIDYPMALCRLVSIDDVCGLSGATGRDMGLMVYGSFFHREGYSILNYDLGIFNGEGINTWDRNKSKDVVGRLILSPAAGVMLSGSYYYGEYGPDCVKRIRYGGGVCYDRGRFVVRGEYIGGTTGDLDSGGWYGVAGVRPAKWLTAAVRYDTFLENRHTTDTRRTNYTVGLTWTPVKFLRCQLDYTYEDYAASGLKNRNVVEVMLTGVF